MASNGASNQRDDLCRVSLDSLGDLKRIQESVNSAALSILQSKLTMHGLSDQQSVFLPHLKQLLERSFDLATPNIRVNGRNLEEYAENEQDADQFDEALDRRVWSLSDQRLKWDLEMALKRRGVPQEVEELMRDLIAQQRAYDDSQRPDEESTMEIDDDAEDIQNNAEFNEDTIEVVQQLKESLPLELERAQRVRQIEAEMRNIRS